MFGLDLGFALAFSLPIDKNKYIRKRPPFSFSDLKYFLRWYNFARLGQASEGVF